MRGWVGAIPVVITALALHAAVAANACKLGVIAIFPVTMRGARPETTASINGQAVTFLIDSGAFYSSITPGTAKTLNLVRVPGYGGLTTRGVGGDVSAGIVRVKAFGVAGQTIPNTEFLVGGSEVGGDDAGLIGANILNIADAEFDLAHGVVRLIRPEGCTRANFPYWTGPGQAYSLLPIAMGKGPYGRITGDAFINGKRIRVQFDTGAASSVISRAAAERAGISVTAPGVTEQGVSSGLGRRYVRTWLVPVDSFRIGDEEIRKTKLRVIDTLLGGNDTPDMLLGADFFLSHHVYAAQGMRTLFFTYNGGNVFRVQPAEPDGTPAATVAAASTDAATSPHLPFANEPTTADEFARRGAAFAGRHEYARAIADLTRAVTLAPADPDALAERARAYLGNRQPFLAMADLDAALKLRPNDVRALVTRAEVKLSGHDQAGARADLAAASAAAPAAADIRFTLGEMTEAAGDLAGAIAEYDRWLPAHPDDVKLARGYNARCWTRALLGTDLALALKDCDAAHRLEPGNVSILDSRALVRLRQGDLARAKADYDTVLAKDPKLAWSLYGRGIVRLRQGDAGGRDDLAAAVTIAPKLPETARKHGIEPPAN